MPSLFDAFQSGLPYAAFIDQYGQPGQGGRWQQTFDQVRLTDAQTTLLGKFKRRMPVLVLAGVWCGDCANQCPIFERFAQASAALDVRYADSAERADVQAALKVNGGNRVPVVVFFSEDGHEVGRYGDRTLSKYRQLAEQQTGDACSSGITRPGDPILAQVTQDWLDEFERVQHILRLSPRLRQLHGD